MNKNMMEVGKAAEHLVCADLILRGYRVFMSDAGSPYDVLVDYDGRIYRVQVRSTLKPKNANARGRNPRFAYVFSARRRGRFGRQKISAAECDIVALVALDIRIVAYFPLSAVGSTMQLDPPGPLSPALNGKSRWARTIDAYPIEGAL